MFPRDALFAEHFIKQLLKVVTAFRSRGAPPLLPDSWKMRVMVCCSLVKETEEGKAERGEGGKEGRKAKGK